MSRIFLSHSSKDNFAAVAIGDWLKENGWDDVFLDVDPAQGIHPGERWERALHEHATRCEAVLFLVSRHWLASDWCRREFELARRLNKRIFVVLIEDIVVGDLPVFLTQTHQAVSLASGEDHVLRRITLPSTHEEGHVTFSSEGLARLKAGLAQAGLDPRFFAWPPEGEPNRAPYRGLEPLESTDAGIFFGRDAQIIEALDALRGLREGASPRLYVILGASGAGKSSFLRAGLLPRLARDDRSFLTLNIIRPERAALTGTHGLVAALAAACVQKGLPATRAELRDAAAKGVPALRPYLRQLVAHTGAASTSIKSPTIVIVVDQAEELFRAEGAQEGASLLALVRDLMSVDEPAVITLFAIRSDSFDELEHARPLEGLSQKAFPLLPMPRWAYQTVIEGPAQRLERTGRKFDIDPALTQALLKDLEAGGGSDALPLLAFTLEQLYLDHGAASCLTRADYEHFGGIKSAIDAAIGRVFVEADKDARIPKDHEARLTLLRRGLIPWLAGIDPETKTPRRRRAPETQIPQEAGPLIDLLVEQRLLTRAVDDSTLAIIVEPAHEALLRQWGNLKGWLTEDFARLAALEGIQQAARDWDANARDAAWAAHSGGRLDEAVRLDARPDLTALLNATDRAYLAACQQKQKEARDKEFALLVAERKAAQRTRIGLSVSCILAILAMCAAAFGFWQAGLAQKQKANAEQQAAIAELSKNDAERQALKAQQSQQNAEEQKEASISNEYRALASTAMAAAKSHQTLDSLKLALAAWPRSDWSKRVRSQNVFAAISTALREAPAPILQLHSDVEIKGFLLQNEDRLVTVTSSTIQVWDVKSAQSQGKPMHHDDSILGATFTPDQQVILSWSLDGTLRFWNVSTGEQIGSSIVVAPRIVVSRAVLAPDGRSVLSWWGDKLSLYEVPSGRSMVRPMVHSDGGSINGAAFSPDGRLILASYRSGEAIIWNAISGQRVGTSMRHDGSIAGAVFSRDKSRILSWSDDKTVRLWDAKSNRQIGPPMRHDKAVIGATFGRDEKRVLSWSEDKTVRIWDAATGRQLGTPMSHDDRVLEAKFSNNQESVLSRSLDHTVRLWNANTQKPVLPPINLGDVVWGAEFSKDDSRILAWSMGGLARIWDTRTGIPLTAPMLHSSAITLATFDQDERRVLTMSRDGLLSIWDVARGTPKTVSMISSDYVGGATFDPTETKVLTWSHDGTASQWDASTGKRLGVVMHHEGAINGASFGPGIGQILTWSGDGSIRFWDSTTGMALGSIASKEPVLSAKYLSGGRLLFSSSPSGIRVLDVLSRSQIGPSMHHSDLSGAAVSTDESRALSWSSDGTVRLWNLATGEPIGPSLTRDRTIIGGAFSSDGRNFIFSSGSTVEVWDAAAVSKVGDINHGGLVAGAQFSGDGSLILSWSSDGTLKLSDSQTLKEKVPTMRCRGPVAGASFSHDGNKIVSWSDDQFENGTIRLWNSKTGSEIGPPMRTEAFSYGAAFSPNDKRVISWFADGGMRLLDSDTGYQLGPTMLGATQVSQAQFSSDGKRVIARLYEDSKVGSARVWDVDYPAGNIVRVACSLLNNFSVEGIEKRYAVKVTDPICTPDQLAVAIDWRAIERAPQP